MATLFSGVNDKSALVQYELNGLLWAGLGLSPPCRTFLLWENVFQVPNYWLINELWKSNCLWDWRLESSVSLHPYTMASLWARVKFTHTFLPGGYLSSHTHMHTHVHTQTHWALDFKKSISWSKTLKGLLKRKEPEDSKCYNINKKPITSALIRNRNAFEVNILENSASTEEHGQLVLAKCWTFCRAYNGNSGWHHLIYALKPDLNRLG